MACLERQICSLKSATDSKEAFFVQKRAESADFAVSCRSLGAICGPLLLLQLDKFFAKGLLGPILPNGVLPDGVHPIYGALFTHFIYSVLPTFLYAFFIYGILLRRASMTCKNINICEL